MVIAGQSPKGTSYNENGDGMPFYQGKKDFGNKFIEAPTTWTTEVTKVAEPNDILMSVRAPVGPVNFTAGKVCIGRGLAAIRVGDEIDEEFLYYQLLAKQPEISGRDGAVFSSISRDEICAIKIACPSISEQRHIVAVLDKAFDAINMATTHTERNLANVRELFESALNLAFADVVAEAPAVELEKICEHARLITYGVIKLGDEVADGVPCLRTSNVRWLHFDLEGLKRISAALSNEYRRTILRGGEVLVSVRGTLGGVAVATSDMAGWNISREVAVVPIDATKAIPQYVAYWIGTKSSQDWFGGVEKGVAYIGINIADLRSLPVALLTPLAQKKIVDRLDRLAAKCRAADDCYTTKHRLLEELKRSVLTKAFSGKLTYDFVSNVIQNPKTLTVISTTDLHAGVLAIAFKKHIDRRQQETFQHVKAEKIAHMVEAFAGVDLGRSPVKDAAGPNDFRHLQQVQHRAERANFFSFKKGPNGYLFKKKNGFDRLIERTQVALGEDMGNVDSIIAAMAPMDSRQAEIFATVFAAWNNLLLDGNQPSDEEIVRAAREDWHPDKLKIERNRFFAAIKWIRDHGFVPKGIGKRVLERAVK